MAVMQPSLGVSSFPASCLLVSSWRNIYFSIFFLFFDFQVGNCFLQVWHYYPFQMMRSEAFFNENLIHKICVSLCVFLWMRCRMYSAWMVAESICVLNGVGLYPTSCEPQVGRGPVLRQEYEYVFVAHFHFVHSSILKI